MLKEKLQNPTTQELLAEYQTTDQVAVKIGISQAEVRKYVGLGLMALDKIVGDQFTAWDPWQRAVMIYQMLDVQKNQLEDFLMTFPEPHRTTLAKFAKKHLEENFGFRAALKDVNEIKLIAEKSMTGQEIATELGVTRAAISKTLKSAMRKMFDFLSKKDKSMDAFETAVLLAKTIEHMGGNIGKDWKAFFELFPPDIKNKIEQAAANRLRKK